MEHPHPRPARRPSPAGHVLLAVLIGLSLGSLLNARALLRTAERLPYGPQRSLAVGITEPLRAVSSLLFLDRPRLALDSLLGRETTTSPVAAPEGEDGASVPDAVTTTTTGPTTTTGVPSPEEGTTLRAPTQEDPLRVWIVGDSLMELLGPSLVNLSDESRIVDAQVDFRFVSGLTRRDFFDWPVHAAEQIPVLQPEVIIAMFGGNDGQDVVVDGVLIEKWSPEWVDVYHERVAEAMDTFATGGIRVYWIGLPVMRSELFSEHVQLMNEVYRREAAGRPGVTVVETWDLFTDESGGYSAYLPDDGGKLQLMRYDDGVHFTWAGARRLASHIFATMEDDFASE